MTDESALVVSLDSIGSLPIIRVAGALDLHTAPAVRQVVAGVVAAEPPPTLIFDLQAVAFMDGSGISMLVAAQKHLDRGQRAIVVITKQPIVLMVLSLAGADGSFIVYPDEETFLASLDDFHPESTGTPE